MHYTVIESATGDELGIVECDAECDDVLDHLCRAGYLEGSADDYVLREEPDDGLLITTREDDVPELLLEPVDGYDDSDDEDEYLDEEPDEDEDDDEDDDEEMV